MKYFSFLLISIILLGHEGRADEQDIIYPLKVNPVSEPWDIRQEARKCMYTSDLCRDAVNAAGAYVGIPPGAIEDSMRTADALGLGASIKHKGEEYWQEFRAPSRYLICNVHVKTISAAPASGKRSPTFSLSVSPTRIKTYNFVHKLPIGQGRSWYEGVLTVHLRKKGSRDWSDCRVPEFNPASYSCKGSQGNNGGYPPCNRDFWVN